MKPAPFAYVRPQGLQHALEALAADPGAKVLAGGQSLVPLLSMRLAAPSTLVDINGLPDLDHVARRRRRASASARWRGTPTCWPRPTYAASSRCCAWRWRTSRTRRSATAAPTVGSIVHADAAAEMPMVLALLGGSVTRRVGRGHAATIPAAELFAGPAGVDAPPRRDRRGGVLPGPARRATASAFDEIARRHGDYALCGVGAVVRVDGDGGRLGARRLPVGLRRPDRRRPDRRRSAAASPTSRSPRPPSWRWGSSTRPTTSTPPRRTAASWCGC